MINTGAELRHARLHAGISQTTLAKLCRVSRNTVIEWEKREMLAYVTGLGLELVLILNGKHGGKENGKENGKE